MQAKVTVTASGLFFLLISRFVTSCPFVFGSVMCHETFQKTESYEKISLTDRLRLDSSNKFNVVIRRSEHFGINEAINTPDRQSNALRATRPTIPPTPSKAIDPDLQ